MTAAYSILFTLGVRLGAKIGFRLSNDQVFAGDHQRGGKPEPELIAFLIDQGPGLVGFKG
jgi:hypothetical protein